MSSLDDSNIISHHDTQQLKRTPLPMFQMFIILLIQSAEPLTATVIYPFVNQFVQDTGVTRGDERKTGYYAGFIESAFFIAEALTVYYWGRASDKWGRRPVLLLGPIGLSIAMLGFGLSTRFWGLVVSRCLQGIFNGNIGVSKSIITEITDSTNIADAYSMMPLMWSFGSTLGPILGGVLSQPAESWPELFGKVAFWHRYPYFLPCAATALISTFSAFFASIGLKETLPSIVQLKQQKETLSHNRDSSTSLLAGSNEPRYGSTTNVDFLTEVPTSHEAPPVSVPLRDLLVPQVRLTLVVYAFLAFVDMGCSVLRPLVWSTSIESGGLAFDPFAIGLIMGIYGIINGIIQILFLGPIIRRFGARTIQVVGHLTYALVLALYPLLRYATRVDDSIVWIILSTQLILSVPNNAAYASMQILIIDSMPNRESLGAINGMAQAVGSIMRSIAPSIASSLFSVSLQKQLLGGNMVFLVLGLVALTGLRLTFLLPRTLQS